MAYHNWKRDRDERLKIFRRWRMHTWFFGGRSRWPRMRWERWTDERHWRVGEVQSWTQEEFIQHGQLEYLQRSLSAAVHQGVSRYARQYRRQWRQAGRAICRLHLMSEHDGADNLHPQPNRLGVMWDIY